MSNNNINPSLTKVSVGISFFFSYRDFLKMIIWLSILNISDWFFFFRFSNRVNAIVPIHRVNIFIHRNIYVIFYFKTDAIIWFFVVLVGDFERWWLMESFLFCSYEYRCQSSYLSTNSNPFALSEWCYYSKPVTTTSFDRKTFAERNTKIIVGLLGILSSSKHGWSDSIDVGIQPGWSSF